MLERSQEYLRSERVVFIVLPYLRFKIVLFFFIMLMLVSKYYESSFSLRINNEFLIF